jgi:hypothetical protein
MVISSSWLPASAASNSFSTVLSSKPIWLLCQRRLCRNGRKTSFPCPREGFVYKSIGRPIAYQELSLDQPWQSYDLRHELTEKGIRSLPRSRHPLNHELSSARTKRPAFEYHHDLWTLTVWNSSAAGDYIRVVGKPEMGTCLISSDSQHEKSSPNPSVDRIRSRAERTAAA